jgi:putative flippase GtrA
MMFLRFCAVGVINTLVGLSIIFGLMRFADADYRSANAVGYALGFMVSYALNRSWTFAHRGDIFRSAIKWTLVVAIAYGLNLAVVIVMHDGCALSAYLAQTFGVPVYTLVSFFGARLFVFPSSQPHLHVGGPQWQPPTNLV